MLRHYLGRLNWALRDCEVLRQNEIDKRRVKSTIGDLTPSLRSGCPLRGRCCFFDKIPKYQASLFGHLPMVVARDMRQMLLPPHKHFSLI